MNLAQCLMHSKKIYLSYCYSVVIIFIVRAHSLVSHLDIQWESVIFQSLVNSIETHRHLCHKEILFLYLLTTYILDLGWQI